MAIFLFKKLLIQFSLGAIVDESGSIVRGFEGGGGICVANHTSPIDVVVLAVDNCYDMVMSL